MLEFEVILKQLCDLTTPACSKSEMSEIVELLLEVVPTWCSIVTVNNVKYLKINTSKSLVDVKREIAAKTEELGV